MWQDVRGRIGWLAVLVIPAATACAYAPPPLDPEPTFARGLERFERGEYERAREDLLSVYIAFPDQRIGERALLALAAIELDPRNPARRLPLGTQLVARYLQRQAGPDWALPLAETLYLVGVELGGAEQRVARAEEQAQAEARRAAAATRRLQAAQAAPPRALPSFPGEPVPARIRALERERDQLATRVRELEQELERIKKTLRP